jgi:hypothetical protein
VVLAAARQQLHELPRHAKLLLLLQLGSTLMRMMKMRMLERQQIRGGAAWVGAGVVGGGAAGLLMLA